MAQTTAPLERLIESLMSRTINRRHKLVQAVPGAEEFSVVISPTQSILGLAWTGFGVALFALLLTYFSLILLVGLFVQPSWALLGAILFMASLWAWFYALTLKQAHGYSGTERVRIYQDRLEIRRSLFGIRWHAGSAAVHEIRGIRVKQTGLWWNNPTRLIVLDCGAKRLAFGGGLRFEQGQELAGVLRRALRMQPEN